MSDTTRKKKKLPFSQQPDPDSLLEDDSTPICFLPPRNPLFNGREKLTSDEWLVLAREAERDDFISEEVATWAFKKGYFDATDLQWSFYNFTNEVIDRKDDVTGNRIPKDGSDRRIEFFSFLTNQKSKFKMLQASRKTWKSSIGAVDYPLWRIGREYFLTDESSIRIMNASEATPLAYRNTTWQKNIMEFNPRFRRFGGEHRTTAKSAIWGRMGILSAQRKNLNIGENTITPFGISSASAGFHYNLVICDDLQAERTSTSRDQIEKCYDFYRLLHSILAREGEMVILSTRWHEIDIYSRIEEENQYANDRDRFDILKIPGKAPDTKDDDGKVIEGKFQFEMFDDEEWEYLRRKHGPYLFSCQFELLPVPDELRTIKKDWIKYRNRFHLQQKSLNVYTSADFAWTEIKRSDFRRSKQFDFTVIFTVAVDEQQNFIFLDQFRKQCAKSESVKELFRQWEVHNSITTILQKQDQRGVKEMIEQYAHDHNKAMYVEWITYPHSLGKVARFETLLQPNFAAHKVFLLENMQWFVEEELMGLPRPKYDDGMDTLANIIRCAKPAKRAGTTDEVSAQKRRIQILKAGGDPWEPKVDFVHTLD